MAYQPAAQVTGEVIRESKSPKRSRTQKEKSPRMAANIYKPEQNVNLIREESAGKNPDNILIFPSSTLQNSNSPYLHIWTSPSMLLSFPNSHFSYSTFLHFLHNV